MLLKSEIELEQLMYRNHSKEHMTQNGQQIFKVNRCYMRQGQPIYTVVDWYDNAVKGTFYQKELQKVDSTDDDIFKVEKVLKYRG